VDQDEFSVLEETFRSGGVEAVFDRLISRARQEQNARLLFDARIMQVRHALGLPLIATEEVLDLSAERRPAYETAFRGAAREAGEICLARGDIGGAWPYFKAIGEPDPVAAAIDNFTGEKDLDRIIEIAYQESVHPRKGFELILKHRGICSAITWFGAGDRKSRQECLRLLVRTLYLELSDSLKQTITNAESSAPETERVADLIAGRPWLFEGNSYYVDSTHLASILRLSPELEDMESVRMALEMANYGQRLNAMFHFRGDHPFEDIYLDYAMYLRALVGEEVDAAIAHFRNKITTPEDATAAGVLIQLLVRLKHFAEAIKASTEYLSDATLQLYQMAGDYSGLRSFAREHEDILIFAAGVIQQGRSTAGPP
jgi:hypothetical protein